jgi:Domain of unknown function (DUF4402)
MLKVNWIYKVFNLTLALLICFSSSLAQPALPQRFNTLRAIQPIHFGSFCITGGSGGTVSVGYDGSRSATGDIVLLNVPPFAQPAIFEIKLGQSASVCFNYEPPYLLLTGGSGSVAFVVGPTNKGPNGALFTTNANTVSQLRVGGTLTVMGSSPPGFYSGIFAISFSRQ